MGFRLDIIAAIVLMAAAYLAMALRDKVPLQYTATRSSHAMDIKALRGLECTEKVPGMPSVSR